MVGEKIVRTRTSFDSGGVELAGYLYRPADATGKLPCVVMGHGFSGTQDRLFVSAERFAGAGMAALTFDYRNFGESGGKPRQVIDIKGQRQDWHAAVSWARSRPEIDPDRVALWGTSLRGTHTIFVAADDSRIAAVAQIPYAGPPKERVGRANKQVGHIMWLALKDRVRGWLGLSPLYVPAVGTADEGAVLVDPHAREVTKSLFGGQLALAQRGRAEDHLRRVAPEAVERGERGAGTIAGDYRGKGHRGTPVPDAPTGGAGASRIGPVLPDHPLRNVPSRDTRAGARRPTRVPEAAPAVVVDVLLVMEQERLSTQSS